MVTIFKVKCQSLAKIKVKCRKLVTYILVFGSQEVNSDVILKVQGQGHTANKGQIPIMLLHVSFAICRGHVLPIIEARFVDACVDIF